MKRNTRKVVVMCLILCLTALLSAVGFAAEINLTDIENHWAKEYIEYGVEKGYINGYTDNTFRPNNTVTRAEFSKMLNSAMKITGTVVTDFIDVKDEDWFSSQVKHGVYAGYIKGYDEDNSFRPNNPISRQEAAVIFSRIMIPTSERANLDVYKDASDVADWAKDAVALISHKGYMKGDQNGNVLPKGNLTRAEAAKLISELIKNENVVSGVVEVKNSQTLSQTIFTDNVTIICEENADVIFEDCRVLGSVEIKSGMVLASLGNTVVGNMVNNSPDDITLMVDANSSVDTLTVHYPMYVSGNGYGKVVLDGNDLQAGTVEFEGNIAEVVVNSNAIIKVSEGKVAKLNVTKPVVVVAQSGKIGAIDVNKNAAGTVITLGQKVSVDEAINKATASYKGLGEIKKAINEVEGVTYEKAPLTTEGKKSNTTGGDEDDESGTENSGNNDSVDDNFFEEVTFSPANKKTGVAVSSNIVLTFDLIVEDKNGDKLTADYIEDNITLRKGSSTGSKVSYKATVNSTKKFTINPTSTLSAGTKYYLVIPEGILYYTTGATNPKLTSYFTTVSLDDDDEGDDSSTGDFEDKSGVEITFSPEYKETDVAVDDFILITFSQKMYQKGGASLTASYVEDYFELRKGSTTGTKLDFKASVTSVGTRVTLSPTKDFSEDTKYYIVIPANCVENSSGETLEKHSSYFTTGEDTSSSSNDDDDDDDDDGTTVTFSPKNGATKVDVDDTIVITFSEKMYNSSGKTVTASYVEDEIELRKKTSTGTKIDFEASVASTGKKITIAPTDDLDKSTKYYVIIPSGTFENSDGDSLAKKTSYFTTTGTSTSSDDDDEDSDTLSIDVTPEDGSKNIVSMPEIEISFSEAVVKTNGKAITDEYIEDDVVELRKSSKTGTVVGFTATVSSNSRKIYIVPNEDLIAGTKYCLYIKADTLMGEDSEIENDAYLSYFTVASSNTPTVSPMTGSKGVPTDTKIVITFKDGLYTTASTSTRKPVTAEYIKDNEVITLRRKTSAGTKMSCDIDINSSGTAVTLTPEDDLALDYKYYVVILGSKLYGESKKAYSATTTYFETNELMVPDFNPEDGDEDVPVDKPLTITFDEALYSKDGKSISKAYLVNDVIRLYVGDDDNGEEVEFSATISSDKTTITVTPEEDLDGNTEYTLVLVGGTLMNENEDLNTAYTINFTTENKVNKTIEFDPENAKTGVPTNFHPTIHFKTKVLQDNCKEVTNQYATSSIILCKGSKSTSKQVYGVNVEVSDGGKTFTIIPDDPLELNTTYYIWILADCFIYSDEKTEVASKSIYFKTTSTMPVLDSIEAASVDETSVELKYTARSKGRIYFELESTDGTEKIETADGCEVGEGSCIITDLTPGTKYVVKAYIVLSGIQSDIETTSFTTLEEKGPDDGNEGTTGGNEGTTGGNEGTTGGNEGTTGGNEGTTGGNEGSTGGNEGTTGGNEGTTGGNEGTTGGDEGTTGGNEGTTGGNEGTTGGDEGTTGGDEGTTGGNEGTTGGDEGTTGGNEGTTGGNEGTTGGNE